MTSPAAIGEICTVDEIAEFLRIDRKTAYRMVKAKKMPGVRKAGRAIRIHKPTVVAWFAGVKP